MTGIGYMKVKIVPIKSYISSRNEPSWNCSRNILYILLWIQNKETKFPVSGIYDKPGSDEIITNYVKS